MKMSVTCKTCGYPGLEDNFYQRNDICECCGFQEGYTDDNLGYTYEAWRKKWIDGGMNWWSKRNKPSVGWNPLEQLKNLKDR